MGDHSQRREAQLEKRLVHDGTPILATRRIWNWGKHGVIQHAIRVPDETLLQNTVTRESP